MPTVTKYGTTKHTLSSLSVIPEKNIYICRNSIKWEKKKGKHKIKYKDKKEYGTVKPKTACKANKVTWHTWSWGYQDHQILSTPNYLGRNRHSFIIMPKHRLYMDRYQVRLNSNKQWEGSICKACSKSRLARQTTFKIKKLKPIREKKEMGETNWANIEHVDAQFERGKTRITHNFVYFTKLMYHQSKDWCLRQLKLFLHTGELTHFISLEVRPLKTT